jgi:SNF2 family DNA or RNA helicase
MLLKHQEDTIQYIINEDFNKNIFLYHYMGCGKTLLVVHLLKRYLQKNNNINILVITTKLLLIQWRSQCKEIQNINFISSRNIKKNNINSMDGNKPCIVIIDEIHNFKNIEANCTKQLVSMIENMNKNKKIIMLSSTPIITSLQDFNIINMLLFDAKPNSNINMKNLEEIKKNTCYFKPDKSFKEKHNMPTYNEKIIYVQFTWEENNLYKKSAKQNMKNSKNFMHYLNKQRSESNNVYYKHKWNIILDKIKEYKKIVIFSDFISLGCDLLEKEILKSFPNINVIKITGKEKNKINKLFLYNNSNNCILILSKTCMEGISLKNTNAIFILEPCWNYNEYLQKIHRCIRMYSFDNMNNKVIDIYLLLNKKTIDTKIYASFNRKKNLTNTVENFFQNE